MARAVVAEDEGMLRRELIRQLKEVWPALEILAECDDGASALEAIETHRPDVAFLDIRMPGLTGLEVASGAGELSPGTQVVFVTAYNQHAIEAFDRGAVDYLLKPVQADRLAATVKRVQARIASGESSPAGKVADEIAARLPEPSGHQPLQWITASAGKETRLILVEDVIYFQADNKYTVVMTAEGESLIRKPIRDLLDVLDPAIFKQIHRSTVVNMRAIAGISRDETGRGTIRLRNRPETLTVSLTFMSLFRNM